MSKVILWSAIVTVLIGGLTGVIGMMGMYALFPAVIGHDEPTCFGEVTCSAAKSYDQLRQTFSVFGWFFMFIPITVWRFYSNKKIEEDTIESD